MPIDRRTVLIGGACAVAPVSASAQPDPLAALIAEYRRQSLMFNARSHSEAWEALTEATYGPALDRLERSTPEPTSPAGVAAAILLARDEPELLALGPIMDACLRYLDGGAK